MDALGFEDLHAQLLQTAFACTAKGPIIGLRATHTPMPKQALHEAAAFRSNTDVAIHVPDLAKAEAFYADVLGFPVVNRGAEYLQFDTGAFQLYANLDDKARPFIPSFSVPDLEVAKRQLKEAGCKQVKAGPTTYYEDPFGFAFDIIAS